jgi:UDP-glucuronate decarboxylase
MLELADRVLSLTASRSRLVRLPLPEDDPRQRRPDIALARTALQWEPVVSLDDGLKETIAYFKTLLQT